LEPFLFRFVRQELYLEPLDPRALHLEHLEAAAIRFDLVALLVNGLFLCGWRRASARLARR